MLCPRCASNQSDDIKFCTFCGANLQAVREAMDAPDSGKKFDWGNTWVAEMFMSGQAQEIRKREMERQLGITPEVKRYNEIKAGVICSCVGIAVSIFLYFLMLGIAAQSPERDAAILLRVWIAGIIPFMVGVALIINGLFVSRKMVEIMDRERKETRTLDDVPGPRGLRPADTNEFIPANMSVTDQTTRHLENAERKVNR